MPGLIPAIHKAGRAPSLRRECGDLEMTTNKEINDMIRAKSGRKVSKIKKSPEAKKNQAINEMIRKKSGRR